MKLYSIQETADILGISRQRVHQLIQANKLASSKVGNINIISSDELKRFKKGRKK